LLLTTPEEPYQPVHMQEHQLAPASFTVTLNEAWRGEVAHCLLTDDHGKLLRYKIKDPSFHNWTGLAMALRSQAISDFPLCNKSFNLSYCGFDL
jgi:Ni,Fe-hydrogenase III large subunit